MKTSRAASKSEMDATNKLKRSSSVDQIVLKRKVFSRNYLEITF